MRNRRLLVTFALAGLVLASVGCAPQVVDAVDVHAAGSPSAGAGSGGASGAGSGGGGASGGAGKPCADPIQDRDMDGTPDCDDGCPDQPLKTEPGVCGCSFPDDDSGDVAGCLNLRDALVNRYTFNGTGRTVVDTAGGRDGALVGSVTLDGAGSVTLGGDRSGQYVDLPNNLISSLTSITLESWVKWSGGREWQRIFDFGDDTNQVEDSRGTGRSYLFLTTELPANAVEGPVARVAYQRGDAAVEAKIDATRAFPPGRVTHVAVTFDYTTKTLALYMQGELEASHAFTAANDVQIRLSQINDINVWLGRSQYSADADFGGVIYEFRVYSEPLTAAQVRTSFSAGMDPEFLP